MSLSRRSLLTGAAGAAAVVSAGQHSAAAAPSAAPTASGPVRTGFARLAAEGYARLGGMKVGVVTNPTGITQDVSHIVDVMHADERVRLTAVFGPEHGFRGTAQAGGSEGFYEDPATGLPVYDTYQASGQKLADIFTRSGVDVVVFDIQDAGARFYTYIWTLYDCMVAAALAGRPFLVLDRPNPVSGRDAYGPVMHPQFATFVGRKAISQQHGMTVAELARLYNGEFVPADAGRPVELDVVTMEGWGRERFFDSTGLPWVLPSPNMPTPDTALAYPGTCLFEGTNLSEGRGTTRPFELLGAEGVGRQWAAAVNELALPGVRFREAYFAPTFSKFQGRTCGGVQVHVANARVYDPVRTGVALLVTAKRSWSGFAWRPDNWIDKLTGSTLVRTMIDAGASADEVVAGWQEELAAFRAVRGQYLLY
ncbi:exo-beta-N-acetylmuramidase NamZ domain-containing protein [Streptomyces polyrhachis]|uniref:Exo-beta-N-acetylmuramidase NamZ domain-containing protein n=1 Tax=Streptomyces polyrhachis TaxID=1282885 RepID=A0ABW2GHZ6_9ACTN